MSIRSVTYYQVACDHPGCGTTTADLGGDYSAWSDAATAREEWECADGLITEHGDYCPTHASEHLEDDDTTEPTLPPPIPEAPGPRDRLKPAPRPEPLTGASRCPADNLTTECPDDCEPCTSDNAARWCNDCRSYAAEDADR